MSSRLPAPLLLTAVLMLGACASDNGEYPSLARRPAERLTAIYDAPHAPVPVVLPAPGPAVTGKLGPLVSAAQAADAKFRQREPRAHTLIGSNAGAKIGSESWGTATVAVAELEAARSETMLALVELDTLYNDTRVRGEDPRQIGTARETVTGLIARQDRVLGELRNQLGS
jgi:hypothetical protein